MRILITGGLGYIGGRLAHHLQSGGHEIILGTRTPDKVPIWLPGAEVVKTVWTDDAALESICRTVDAIVHASGMNALDCAADPVSALEINGLGTARLVRAAAMVGIKRFIYLSTAHVYGAPLAGDIHEGSCPRNMHPYATSHLAGEAAVLNAGHQRRMSTLVLRLSNAFGAPVDEAANCWMLLVNDLCRQAVTSGELKLQTSGSQQRDFIPVTEVCKVINNLLVDTGVPAPFDVLNLGAGVSMSVRQMAERIKLQCKSSLGFEPKLVCPEPQMHELAERLAYRIDRLRQLHISVNPDPGNEINELLQFCRVRF